MSIRDLIFLAEDVVRATRARLPRALRERSDFVLTRYDTEPDAELLADGIEPDTMGLFEGCAYAEQLNSADALPPRIILFLAVIWDECDGNKAAFRDEVRRTYLHERVLPASVHRPILRRLLGRELDNAGRIALSAA